jgi:glycosyltransferase involved in cell wall biosynthesis
MSSSSPHVLFIGDKFGYPGGVAHGGTTYFLQVLPALAEAGVEVTSCFLREAHPLAEPLFAQGLDPVFLAASPLDPSPAWRLTALARQHGCNVIHASGIKAALMARIAARLAGAQTAVHVHDQKHTGFAVSHLHKLFARRTDIGICVSQAVGPTAVGSYHVSPDRLRVIPNGIQLERFRAVPSDARVRVRQSLGIPVDRPALGMFGRMYPVKGHRAMLRMLPEILRGCPDALLLIAGDGPERGPCEALAASLGLDRSVIFLGHRNDIPELLSACDLFMMPSETEGLPYTAIEAYAMGVPVVGFDVGGVGEVVDDGADGFLVPHGDSAAFCAAVLSLLIDAGRRAEFAARALQAVERFSIEAHVARLVDCYRELTSVPS